MDSCYLIGFPWTNKRKSIVSNVTSDFSKKYYQGYFSGNNKYPLPKEYDKDELRFIIESNTLHLFLDKNLSTKIRFKYEDNSLIFSEN